MAQDVTIVQSLRRSLETLSRPITSLSDLHSILSNISHDLASARTSQLDKIGKVTFLIQKELVEKVLPVWRPALRVDSEEFKLVHALFVPATPNSSGSIKGKDKEISQSEDTAITVALSSFQSISSSLTSATKLTSEDIVHLLDILRDLLLRYPFDRIYSHLIVRPDRADDDRANDLTLQTYTSTLLGLSSKVGNLLGRLRVDGQGRGSELGTWDEDEFWAGVCRGVEEVIWTMSARECKSPDSDTCRQVLLADINASACPAESDVEPLLPLFARMTTLNLFPLMSTPTPIPPARAFFVTCMSRLVDHLERDRPRAKQYAAVWRTIQAESPSKTRRAIVGSFFTLLTSRTTPSDQPRPDGQIKRIANLLCLFTGQPDKRPEGTLTQDIFPLIFLKPTGLHASTPRLDLGVGGRRSGEWERMAVRARAIVTFSAGAGKEAVAYVLDEVMRVWGDPVEVKYGLMGRGAFLTLLIILLVSELPPYDPLVTRITYHSPFLVSMQSYLGHSDPAIRRLGMLVGEIISRRSIPSDDDDEDEQNAWDRRRKTKDKDRVVKELEGMLDDLDVDDKADASRSTPTRPPPKVKRLDFGKDIWEGSGGGREECMWLRAFLGVCDSQAEIDIGDEMLGWQDTPKVDTVERNNSSNTDGVQEDADSDDEVPQHPVRGRSSRTKLPKPAAIVDSDDDSLVGYSDSSPSSSRSPSPTPSYLEEVANDPMLNTSTREKVQRPVYLMQLLELLRARTEPEKLEVALKWGEELIRRKRDYGTELDENAEELVHQTLALSDPYDLEDFEKRRQGIVTALTACSPRIVAPLLLRLYFEAQYSLVQRSAILTGLSMGARECAGLPLAIEQRRAKVDFPSKFLPPALHAKYASASDPGFLQANKTITAATDSVTNEVLRRGRDSTADKHPEVVRHRQLRVAGSSARSKITDMAAQVKVVEQPQTIANAHPPKLAFKDIAAEYFILPMINRFWTYLQEEVTREQQTQGKYAVGGTGTILSSLAVSQFLSTLTIMVHAARHSPLYLSVICPEALELAISVGSKLSVAPEFTPLTGSPKEKAFESDVVATALELALVSVDGAQQLDGGRAIATEKSLTLMAAGEWASDILQKESQGQATTTNVGGSKEGRVQKAAAGLLVLVSGIVEKMQNLMT